MLGVSEVSWVGSTAGAYWRNVGVLERDFRGDCGQTSRVGGTYECGNEIFAVYGALPA